MYKSNRLRWDRSMLQNKKARNSFDRQTPTWMRNYNTIKPELSNQIKEPVISLRIKLRLQRKTDNYNLKPIGIITNDITSETKL